MPSPHTPGLQASATVPGHLWALLSTDLSPGPVLLGPTASTPVMWHQENSGDLVHLKPQPGDFAPCRHLRFCTARSRSVVQSHHLSARLKQSVQVSLYPGYSPGPQNHLCVSQHEGQRGNASLPPSKLPAASMAPFPTCRSPRRDVPPKLSICTLARTHWAAARGSPCSPHPSVPSAASSAETPGPVLSCRVFFGVPAPSGVPVGDSGAARERSEAREQ